MGNTGVERTGRLPGGGEMLGCGWLAGTVRGRGVEAVKGVFERRLGLVSDQGYGSKWYGASARVGDKGAVLAWSPRGQGSDREDRSDEVFFDVPQSACDVLGWAGCANLAAELQELGAHWTRCDVNFDDQERVAEPADVLAAYRAGQRVTRVTSWSWRARGRGEAEAGSTCYLGAPTAETQLRVYDKDAEQGVVAGTHGVRWELQCRAKRAGELVESVVLNVGEDRTPAEAFAQVLVRHCDFRERAQSEAHGERRPRLPWWSQLVGRVAKASCAVARVVDSLERRRAWIERQASPTLALLLAAAGGDVDELLDVARRGLKRLRPEHWQLVPVHLRPGWSPGG